MKQVSAASGGMTSMTATCQALLLALGLAAMLALPQASADAAPLWSSLPKPFKCDLGGKIVPDNSCVEHTGFRPNAGTGDITPWWGQYRNRNGNCTAYVAYRLINNGASNFLVSGRGSAVHWREHAESNVGKRAVDNIPAVGAVAWYDFGHVAYVEKVSAGGTKVYLSESHWQTRKSPAGSRRLIVKKGSPYWPDEFLHVKDRPASPVARYAGYIVQWKGDRKKQKTAWLVGSDLRRRWIPDISTYRCLKAKGVPGPVRLPAWKLDKLTDLNGVHAECTPPAPSSPPAPEVSPPPAPEPTPSSKPGPAEATAKNVLRDDQRLRAAKNEYLRSSDGRYRFVMQSDSNLVLYGPSGRPLWASDTVGRGADHLRMQGDGNLVVYNAKDKPIWASNTPRHYNARLVVQNDGNVVIYEGSRPLWATGTAGRR